MVDRSCTFFCINDVPQLACMMDGNPAETRAAAAKVVTAVCNHNKGHQLLLVGRNVMPPLVAMLAGPTTPQVRRAYEPNETVNVCDHRVVRQMRRQSQRACACKERPYARWSC